MIPLPLEALADVVAGELADPADGDRVADAVTIDSRTAAPGALFVALQGEHADGHDFIADAAQRGAAGYLAEAGRPLPDAPGGVIVDDPADALLGLGAWIRDEVGPAVVGVTGSNGKTTTKDLIAAAVGAGRTVVASRGSFNNDLGVPLTLCRLDSASEVLVAEIGARGRGQIARLMPVIRPDIAVVTTVAGAHLEMFGSIAAVAESKAELVQGLHADGLAVLNADDPRVAAMASLAPGAVVTYGRGEDADWRAEHVELDAGARARFHVRGVTVRLPLPGEHNIGNALAALAVADACKVPLPDAAAAVENAPVSRWRMELRSAPGGVAVLNDAYNANPASTEAALRTLARMTVAGRRWVVLGRMAELGEGGPEAHARIGRLAGSVADGLVAVADPADPEAAATIAEAGCGTLAADTDHAVELLRTVLRPGDVVLVKASRSVGLERVADALTGPAPGAGGAPASPGGRGPAR